MATINGIEQGVSCYSYTQQFVEREDFGIDTIFRRIADKGVHKVELVGAQTFQRYPTAARSTRFSRPGRGTASRSTHTAATSTSAASPATP